MSEPMNATDRQTLNQLSQEAQAVAPMRFPITLTPSDGLDTLKWKSVTIDKRNGILYLSCDGSPFLCGFSGVQTDPDSLVVKFTRIDSEDEFVYAALLGNHIVLTYSGPTEPGEFPGLGGEPPPTGIWMGTSSGGNLCTRRSFVHPSAKFDA